MNPAEISLPTGRYDAAELSRLRQMHARRYSRRVRDLADVDPHTYTIPSTVDLVSVLESLRHIHVGLTPYSHNKAWDVLWDLWVSRLREVVGRVCDSDSKDPHREILDMLSSQASPTVIRERCLQLGVSLAVEVRQRYSRSPASEERRDDSASSSEKKVRLDQAGESVGTDLRRYIGRSIERTASLQSLPSAARAAVFPDHVELDLQCCQPAVLALVASKLFPTESFPSLQDYVSRYPAPLTEILSGGFYDRRFPLRAERKSLLKSHLIALFNSHTPVGDGREDERVEAIVGDVRRLRDLVNRDGSLFRYIKYYCLDSALKRRKRPLNSLLANIFQTIESELMNRLIIPFVQRAIGETDAVSLQLFDGCLVPKRYYTEELLDSLNDYLRSATVVLECPVTEETYTFPLVGSFIRARAKPVDDSRAGHLTWQDQCCLDMGLDINRVVQRGEDWDLTLPRGFDCRDETSPGFDIGMGVIREVLRQQVSFIQAGMAMGKTNLLKQLLLYLKQTSPEYRVIVITNRISQCKTAVSRLSGDGINFHFYRARCERKGCGSSDRFLCKHQKTALSNQQYLAIQYDSLKHLRFDVDGSVQRWYDVVIIDEVYSVDCQSVSENLREWKLPNFKAYNSLIQRSKHSVLVDDDLFCSRIPLELALTEWCRPDEMRVFYYQRRAQQRQVLLSSQVEILNDIAKKITANPPQPVGVVCSSKRTLKTLYTYLSSVVDPSQVLMVHADTEGKDQILDSLCDNSRQEQACRDKLVVMFSSVITTGLEFLHPVYGVYVFLSTSLESVSSQTLHQQVGRFRKVVGGQVWVTTAPRVSITYKTVNSVAMERRRLVRARHRVKQSALLSNKILIDGVSDQLLRRRETLDRVDDSLVDWLQSENGGGGALVGMRSHVFNINPFCETAISYLEDRHTSDKTRNRFRSFLLMAHQKGYRITVPVPARKEDVDADLEQIESENRYKVNLSEYNVCYERVYTEFDFFGYGAQLFAGLHASQFRDNPTRAGCRLFPCDEPCSVVAPHVHGLVRAAGLSEYRKQFLDAKKDREGLTTAESFERGLCISLTAFDMEREHGGRTFVGACLEEMERGRADAVSQLETVYEQTRVLRELMLELDHLDERKRRHKDLLRAGKKAREGGQPPEGVQLHFRHRVDYLEKHTVSKAGRWIAASSFLDELVNCLAWPSYRARVEALLSYSEGADDFCRRIAVPLYAGLKGRHILKRVSKYKEYMRPLLRGYQLWLLFSARPSDAFPFTIADILRLAYGNDGGERGSSPKEVLLMTTALQALLLYFPSIQTPGSRPVLLQGSFRRTVRSRGVVKITDHATLQAPEDRAGGKALSAATHKAVRERWARPMDFNSMSDASSEKDRFSCLLSKIRPLLSAQDRKKVPFKLVSRLLVQSGMDLFKFEDNRLAGGRRYRYSYCPYFIDHVYDLFCFVDRSARIDRHLEVFSADRGSVHHSQLGVCGAPSLDLRDPNRRAREENERLRTEVAEGSAREQGLVSELEALRAELARVRSGEKRPASDSGEKEPSKRRRTT